MGNPVLKQPRFKPKEELNQLWRHKAEEEIDLDIAKLVQKKQQTDSSFTEASEEPMKIHIWDFAGQELYYTTHQVNDFHLVEINEIN